MFNGLPSNEVEISLQQTDEFSIPYIRPSSVYDNVIAGYVNPSKIDKKHIFEEDEIFVSTDGQGSHSYAYVSAFRFVPNSNVAVLRPKGNMDINTKIFYALCITRNRYKFSYGRKPKGERLGNIKLPTIPKEFLKIKIEETYGLIKHFSGEKTPKLETGSWKTFQYSDLFAIKKGKRLTKEDMDEGDTPFVGAIDSNNGWREFIGQKPIHEGNTITVNYNGSVAEAFYQPIPFWASDDVNVLYPKFDMTIYTALFIIVIIKMEKYRFNFGRKWHKERMEESVIKLPAIGNEPDFSFMENYVKSLPFSAKLLKERTRASKVKHIKDKTVKIREKGLSDDELIKKYEAGKIILQPAIKKMIKTPSPSSVLKTQRG